MVSGEAPLPLILLSTPPQRYRIENRLRQPEGCLRLSSVVGVNTRECRLKKTRKRGCNQWHGKGELGNKLRKSQKGIGGEVYRVAVFRV